MSKPSLSGLTLFSQTAVPRRPTRSLKKIRQIEKLKRSLWAAISSGASEAQALKHGCRTDLYVNRTKLKQAWDLFQREWQQRYGGGPCTPDNEHNWSWLISLAARRVCEGSFILRTQ